MGPILRWGALASNRPSPRPPSPLKNNGRQWRPLLAPEWQLDRVSARTVLRSVQTCALLLLVDPQAHQ